MNWNPHLIYNWTKKQVEQWVEIHGGWSFYNGYMYHIKAKKIFGKMYEVRFIKE